MHHVFALLLSVMFIVACVGCDGSDKLDLEETPPPTTLETFKDCAKKLKYDTPPERRIRLFRCASHVFTKSPECGAHFKTISELDDPLTHKHAANILHDCSQSYCAGHPHDACSMSLEQLEAMAYEPLKDLAANTYLTLLTIELEPEPDTADAAAVGATARLLATHTIPLDIEITLPKPSPPTKPPKKQGSALQLVIASGGFVVRKNGERMPAVASCPQGTDTPTLCLADATNTIAVHRYDWMGLYNLLLELKLSSPVWQKHRGLEVIAGKDITFDIIIKTMDIARQQRLPQDAPKAKQGKPFSDKAAFESAQAIKVDGNPLPLFDQVVMGMPE